MKRTIDSYSEDIELNIDSKYKKRIIEYDKFNILDMLIDDIIIYIMTFLNDKKKIRFLSTTTRLHLFKNKVCYNEITDMYRIYDLPYYDRFNNVSLAGYEIFCGYKLPKSIKYLTFHTSYGIDEDIKDFIPEPNPDMLSEMGWDINKDVKNYIPDTVTHLTFSFDKPIKHCIPSSITHLTFGRHFNQNIKGCIPNSVT